MKGGSREAKEHKSTGGERTWYGKRENLSLCPLLPIYQELRANRDTRNLIEIRPSRMDIRLLQ